MIYTENDNRYEVSSITDLGEGNLKIVMHDKIIYRTFNKSANKYIYTVDNNIFYNFDAVSTFCRDMKQENLRSTTTSNTNTNPWVILLSVFLTLIGFIILFHSCSHITITGNGVLYFTQLTTQI